MNKVLLFTATLMCFVCTSGDADAQLFRRCRAQSRVCVPNYCPPMNSRWCNRRTRRASCYSPCTLSLDCSFSGSVQLCGDDVCVNGTIRCAGMECRINSRIRSGCATVDCGDLKIRMCIDGSRVCFEAKARICGPPYPCNCSCCLLRCNTCQDCSWTGWNDILCVGF